MLTLVHGSLLRELAITDTLHGYVPLVNHLKRDKKWKLWHLGLIRSKDLLTPLFEGETNTILCLSLTAKKVFLLKYY